MTPAPPLDCHCCHRRIGKTAGHYLIEGDRVVCSGCAENRAHHADVYPDCPHQWHDLIDHLQSTGTRAGIAHRLGRWP